MEWWGRGALGYCSSLSLFPSPFSIRRCSAPQLAVEGAELDGLGNVLGGDAVGRLEVGNGAGDLEDAVCT